MYDATWEAAAQKVIIEEVEEYKQNYWLSEDEKAGGRMILDLGFVKQIGGFFIRNTHNAGVNDRATKDFTLFVWNSPATSWTIVFNGTF